MISLESNALAMRNAIVKTTGKAAPANAKILTILFISVRKEKVGSESHYHVADYEKGL